MGWFFRGAGRTFLHKKSLSANPAPTPILKKGELQLNLNVITSFIYLETGHEI